MQERTQYEFYKPYENFGHKEGFNVAVALTDWDYSDSNIEDPSIGEVKFILKSWGNVAGEPFTELESSLCDDSGFEGIDDIEFD